MTGREMLEDLQSRDPNELDLEMVVEGPDGWVYEATGVDVKHEFQGRVYEDVEKAHPRSSPALIITSNS